MRRSTPLAAFVVGSLFVVAAGACGGKKAVLLGDGGVASASASVSDSPPAPVSIPTVVDEERERGIQRSCQSRAERECDGEAHERKAFYDEKAAQIAKAPFDVKVDRVWLRGTCAHGDTPEKRDDTEGITALVEGKITYKGNDSLLFADPEGWAYLDTGDDHVFAMSAADKSYSGYGGPKLLTRMVRRVRGSDPWRPGETRDFHWESRPFSEAFCEVKPKSSAVLMELRVLGEHSAVETYPVSLVPLPWEEVVGTALKENVSIHHAAANSVDEAADATYSRLEKILVTGASGKSEWMARTSIIQSGFLTRAPAPPLPATVESPGWSVVVTKVAGAKDFGDYAPAGEDQFLEILDVELTSKADDGKSTKAKAFGFQLETSPGTWRSPVAKAAGQLDGTADIGPGEKVTGQLVFARQRFERPFRLQVKTPDRQTLLTDVFTYDVGPESWK
jgi:hypothetical protein